MKKLKLALESLEVVSFEAVSSERLERGTVLGRESILPADTEFCPESQECDHTLAISCVPDGCMSHEYVTCPWQTEAC